MKLFKYLSSFFVSLVIAGGTTPYIPFYPGVIGGGEIIPIIPVLQEKLVLAIEPLSTRNTDTYMNYYFSTSGASAISFNLKIYIVNDLYPNGYLISEQSGRLSSKTKIIKYDNSATRSSNSIKIVYTIGSQSEVITSHTVMTITRETKQISNNQVMTSPVKALTYIGDVWNEVNVSYTFSDYSECLMPTYYHELDLSSLNFNCSNTNFATNICNDINLLITNREGVFDGFDHDELNATIPLSLISDSKGNHLAFKEVMYVEPNTLLMSKTQKQGYVETKHLYFPRNEMKYQGDYEFSIIFKNFGINKSSLSSKHKIKALINTLGDCYNSEYCILNNDAEVNDLGWVI